MSYQQYSGNPYGQNEGGYGSNPYSGGGYESSNPYAGQDIHQPQAPSAAQQGNVGYNQGYQSAPASGLVPNSQLQPVNPLSRDDFLQRIEGAKSRIGELTSSISQIANIHQRLLSSPDSNSTAQLEGLVAQTQVRNTQIKDEIKFLEKDAAREPQNSFKRTQVESLKRTFKAQLEDYQREESDYGKRYREAIARQYRVVNPNATEAEVQEAANANWGDEGIFQQALKSNRSGQASSVLGAVRARHNDIQQIESTLSDLALLFQQLNEAVVMQEYQVQNVEDQTVQVTEDAKNANQQLDSGIKSARNRNKLKWWVLGIVVLIILIVALAVGLYFGVGPGRPANNNNNSGQ